MGEEEVTYERKMELGIIFESEASGSGRSGPGYIHVNLIRAALAEFIGMLLFLFFVITIARFLPGDEVSLLSTSATTMISIGFGLSIFVLVYILAEASGANLNPAVSIGLLVARRISVERFVLYVIAQVLGAMAGAGIATTFLDTTDGGYNSISDGVTAEDAFGGEVLCTFLLVTTVFAATDGVLGQKHGHIHALLPFAIGMAVLLAHLVLIPVDGCSINPARSFATSVTNNIWDDHWVFWAGPLVGGVLAAVVWEAVLRPEQPVKTSGKGSTM